MPINTIPFRGKQYATVASRVAAAHEVGGFAILATDVLELGNTGRFYVKVAIQFDGSQYIGMSEIPQNAKPGSAEATAPIEVAETSAVGRALAFAGFGIDGSIASADEMRMVDNQSPQLAQAAPSEAQQPVSGPQINQHAQEARKAASSPARAATGGKAAWYVTADGYDPMSDPKVHERLAGINRSSIEDKEAFFRKVKDNGSDYTKRNIYLAVVAAEELAKQEAATEPASLHGLQVNGKPIAETARP